MKRAFAVSLLLALGGCPKNVTIYRSLSAPGAMQTCDANQQLRVEVVGKDEADARSKGEDQIRESIRARKGCGALIINDGAGSRLDGGFSYTANYQFCSCQ